MFSRLWHVLAELRGRVFLPAIVLFSAVAIVSIPGSLNPGSASAATLPSNFQQSVAISGLSSPTAVRFSPDGRVFVAEKSGVIKVFDSLSDSTPTVFVDLNTNVYNFWDRGLLGLELDPDFPTEPYVYVLYAYDADIGGTAPKWGTSGVHSDPCPNPPGATGDGCVVSGRLSKLHASGDVMTGSEVVLIEDWCQQYPSHSTGSLAFGADGALYASGGDGASFNFTDYGQDGSPRNPCGDPPGGVGATLSPPTAEGGALRSQDLRTGGDPTSLDGTIIRVDPDTGAGLPDNPLASSADANERRIVAYGLRNPFRITIRPGTNEVWAGDVGWGNWEEINRVVSPFGVVENFGWPCYEGVGRQSGYDGANLNICQDLYDESGAVVEPHYTYKHSDVVVNGESCPTGSSSTAGVAFYEGGDYPAAYHDALFFADYSRDCIWVMFADGSGIPDPSARSTFVAGASNPVDLQIGPNGDLFYVDINGGNIWRVEFFSTNQPPTADLQAAPTSGAAPLTVDFDATGSSDPDPGDTLSYEWDLDGDGAYDDSTAAQPSFTYTQPGSYNVGLRVTDLEGADDTDTVLISVQNTPPDATILTPLATDLWTVGDSISFSGSATDAQDGTLPASAFEWSVILHHCPSNCHTHSIQDFSATKSGSFTAPDHEYPSHLELQLTVNDSGTLSDSTSVFLYPETVTLDFESTPSGLEIVVDGASGATPFSRTVMRGSNNSVSAPSPQTHGGDDYLFESWSDGGAQAHNVIASASGTYTATFEPALDTEPPTPPSGLAAPSISSDHVALVWGASTDDTGVTGYEVIRNGSSLVNLGVVTAYNDTAVTPNTTYTYTVRARDAAGNWSDPSNVLTLATNPNLPPTAVAQASPLNGVAPLTVDFDATASSDPDPGDTLSYEWDLDGDGAYDDSTAAGPSFTYGPGTYTVGLRVSDSHGASNTDSLTIAAQNTAPTGAIDAPDTSLLWSVGDSIFFTGSGSDPQDGDLGAEAFAWRLIVHDCELDCHTHVIHNFPGTTSGSFFAPDHGYPSHLELELTVTDSAGLSHTSSVLLYPETVALDFESSPAGLELVINDAVGATPFSRTAIRGSTNTLSAPSPLTHAGDQYSFESWSDLGAQTHQVVASVAATYVATYELAPDTGGGGGPAPDPDPTAEPPVRTEQALPLGVATAFCKGEAATIVGTDEDDRLWGTSGRDVIVALAGEDVVWGLGGNDLICLGAGDDRGYGGSGGDRLYGQGGDDRIYGQADSDFLSGGGGIDLLAGGRGDDVLGGGPGSDRLLGKGGDDRLFGRRGWDSLFGNGGSARRWSRARSGRRGRRCRRLSD